MKLNHLTDNSLLKDMSNLASQERAIISKVLWHLKEIDRRKLYCDLKCGSLFEYCVKVLKYSEAQASRRVTASRLLRDIPEIAQQIENGRLNLTQLNQAKQFFSDEGVHEKEQKKKIIDLIVGKTTKETERLLWELKSEDSPRMVHLRLKEKTLMRLKKVQALKAHAFPEMDSLLERMCEEMERIWEPGLVKRPSKVCIPKGRYVPVQVKAEVWKRDGGKCKNCGSVYALEYDHIRPYGIGGKSQIENLRILCRACNQRKGHAFYKRSPPFS